MIFDALYESAKKGELLLVDGGMCRYHVRRNGQLTIYEIISTRRGAGSKMLAELIRIKGISTILARCPARLLSNEWYKNHGFVLARTEQSKNKQAKLNAKFINVWILTLPN